MDAKTNEITVEIAKHCLLEPFFDFEPKNKYVFPISRTRAPQIAALIDSLSTENAELKRQVAEKEAEIKQITQDWAADECLLHEAMTGAEIIQSELKEAESRANELEAACAAIRKTISIMKDWLVKMDGLDNTIKVLDSIRLITLANETLNSTTAGRDLLERVEKMRTALESIANREGHYLKPETIGPDDKGMYTVIGPGKPELTRQCAHWMRNTAREALSACKEAR